jgi:hypothetical protein
MNTRQISRGAGVAMSWLALGVGIARGQAPADSLRERCDRVTSSVAAGRRDHMDRYGFVVLCGEPGAAALARSWAVWKSVSDRAALVRFANDTRPVRNTRVFDALMDVAADEAATPVARALALRNLRVMRDPGAIVPLENLEALAAALAGPDRGQDANTGSLCGHTNAVSDVYVPSGPAPSAGELQRLSALRRQLLTSRTTPPLVRAGAMCS